MLSPRSRSGENLLSPNGTVFHEFSEAASRVPRRPDRVEVVPAVDDLAVAEGEDGDVAVAVGGAGAHDLARGGVLQDDRALGWVVVHGQVVAAVQDERVAVGSPRITAALAKRAGRCPAAALLLGYADEAQAVIDKAPRTEPWRTRRGWNPPHFLESLLRCGYPSTVTAPWCQVGPPAHPRAVRLTRVDPGGGPVRSAWFPPNAPASLAAARSIRSLQGNSHSIDIAVSLGSSARGADRQTTPVISFTR